MRKMIFKIQMLAGNRLKVYVGVGFEISSTLVTIDSRSKKLNKLIKMPRFILPPFKTYWFTDTHTQNTMFLEFDDLFDILYFTYY